MGVIGNSLLAASGGRTKWDVCNTKVREYLDGLVCAGKIDRYVQKNYVPGKLDMVYVFRKKWDRSTLDLQHTISQAYGDIREGCGIDIREVLDDWQMHVMPVTEKTFDMYERQVAEWPGTV